jgi:hypothetical protein
MANSNVITDDGFGGNQRVGDEIYQKGFKIKMMLYNKVDRPNLTWKVRVLSAVRGTFRNQSGIIDYDIIHRNITGNNLLDDINSNSSSIAIGFFTKRLQIFCCIFCLSMCLGVRKIECK